MTLHLRAFLTLLFLSAAQYAFAQRTVTGKITSSDDNSGIPATIRVIGSDPIIGANADIEGNFTINVPADDSRLLITSIGYKPKEVLVGTQSALTILLGADVTTLNETVITGYTSQERKDVAGSIAKIEGSALKNNSVSSFDQALQGRAPGLQVTQGAGTPGSSVRIRVRGQGAISGGGDPLIVIDGVPMSETRDFSDRGSNVNAVNTNVLSQINPGDIESIEVLKDASSAAIYGARGANGVVLITTKRGKAGKTSFDLNYYTGVSTPTNRLKFLNGPEWLQLFNEAKVNDGGRPLAPNETFTISGIPITPNSIGNTNWLDDVFRAGRLHDVTVGSNGGTDKVRFYVGGNFRKEESFLKGGDFQRLSTRFNITNKATDRFEYGLQSSLNWTINNQVPTGFNNGGLGVAQSSSLPIWPINNPDGTFFGTQRGLQNTFFNSAAYRQNKYRTDAVRTFFNLNATYKITKDLSYKGLAGFDLFRQRESAYNSAVNRYYNGRPLAAFQEINVNATNFNTYHTLNYAHDFNEENYISLLAGAEANLYQQRNIGLFPASGAVGLIDSSLQAFNSSNMSFAPWAPDAAKQGAAVGGYNDITNFYRFISFFGQATYRYKNKYLLNASVRQDGSSRFGPGNRFAVFPSAGLGWIISQEDFLNQTSWLSLLKLRTSFGVFGSSDIQPFQWLGAYNSTGGYLGSAGYQPSTLPNPNLSWSQSQMMDASIDYGFLNNRIVGTMSVYRRISTDLLLSRPIQASATGDAYIPGDPSATFGVVVNENKLKVRDLGAELNILTRNLVSTAGGLSWTTEFNISSNQNRVVNVSGIPPDGFGSSPGDARVVQGYPIGISYLAEYAGVDPLTGRELIYDIKTREKIPVSADNVQPNRVPLGSPFPKFYGGLNNTLSIAGFDLSFLFSYSFGSTIYDDGGKYQQGGRLSTWNQRKEILDRWQKPGDITEVPKLTLNTGYVDKNNTSRFLYKNDYVRLRTIQIGYTLPKSMLSRLGVTALRVYVSGQNLLTFTNYKGWDPEVTRYQFSRTDGNVAFASPYLPTPQARQITAGVNLSF
jgi:TonB-dependent starch-binding outer membrane protein SusC